MSKGPKCAFYLHFLLFQFEQGATWNDRDVLKMGLSRTLAYLHCIPAACTLHRDQADLVNQKYLCLYLHIYLYLYYCRMHRDQADLVNWNIFSCKTSLASFTTCLRLSMLSSHLDLATNVKCFQKSLTEHLKNCLSGQKTVAQIAGTNSFKTISAFVFAQKTVAEQQWQMQKTVAEQ